MYELVPMEIAASGMRGQQVRLGVISSNLANARSTRQPDGSGPYQRRQVIFEANQLPSFKDMLQTAATTGKGGSGSSSSSELTLTDPQQRSNLLLEEHLRGVAQPVIEKLETYRSEYDPSHPDADPETGVVKYPDINVMSEMTDMISASRDYEANLAVMRNTRDMVYQLIDLLKA
jgi:flagellar basal-body rod protein FlgC